MRLRAVLLPLGGQRQRGRSGCGRLLDALRRAEGVVVKTGVLHASRLRGRGESDDNRDFHIYSTSSIQLTRHMSRLSTPAVYCPHPVFRPPSRAVQ